MEFREYATHEMDAVVDRLMTSQAEAQVRRAREALEAAARALDTTAAPVAADDEVRDLVQRLEAAAGIAVQRVQQDAQKAVDGVRAELAAARRQHEEAGALVTTLRGEIAALTDRASTAEADLDATIEAHRQIEMELGGLRDMLDTTRREAARLAADLEAEHAERTVLTAELAAARQTHASLEASVAAAQSSAVEEADLRATLQGELDAARTRLASLEQARAALQADLDATRAALKAAEAERDRVTLLDAAASACRELGSAESMTQLMALLVQQVAKQFTRAAIFRVKAHHLEGEHAIGFDAATDVSKLIIPLTLDSLVTRAHATGTLARLGPGDAAAGPAPFDGSPHVAVAVPISFQGEILAVLYADSDHPAGPHEERPAYASVLAGHATVLLGRMSHERKTLQELRDYAAMLLQEAHQMYGADVETGRSDAERRRRLQDTIECARQLYGQRAALEGTSAAGLLDEHIAATIKASPATPFAQDLARATGHAPARRSAS